MLRAGALVGGIAFAGVMQGVYERMYSEEAAVNEYLKRKKGGLGVPAGAWPLAEGVNPAAAASSSGH
jgi:hypothetical protein